MVLGMEYILSYYFLIGFTSEYWIFFFNSNYMVGFIKLLGIKLS